jgi:hypothetical protein
MHKRLALIHELYAVTAPDQRCLAPTLVSRGVGALATVRVLCRPNRVSAD